MNGPIVYFLLSLVLLIVGFVLTRAFPQPHPIAHIANPMVEAGAKQAIEFGMKAMSETATSRRAPEHDSAGDDVAEREEARAHELRMKELELKHAARMKEIEDARLIALKRQERELALKEEREKLESAERQKKIEQEFAERERQRARSHELEMKRQADAAAQTRRAAQPLSPPRATADSRPPAPAGTSKDEASRKLQRPPEAQSSSMGQFYYGTPSSGTFDWQLLDPAPTPDMSQVYGNMEPVVAPDMSKAYGNMKPADPNRTYRVIKGVDPRSVH